MAHALDHIAELTRTRDRSLVDASLLEAMLDLMEAHEASIWRPRGEADGTQRWVHELVQSRGGPARGGEDSAPLALDALPEHRRVLGSGAPASRALADGETVLLLPMAGEREAEGVIELRLDAPLSARDEKIARAVLRIHANFLQLLDYSERDTLTGLLNRKSFDETFLKAALLGARRAAPPEGGERRQGGVPAPRSQLFLGVIDVDHFKRVNDEHGHLIGDEVLVLVARLMRGALRSDDRLYRFGGEEFVVLLEAGDEAAAGLVFERLRTAVAAYDFPRVKQVTVSIGYTAVHAGDTPQAAFARADQGVYHAKASGRNCVQAYAVLLASGHAVDNDGSGAVELF